MLSHGGFSHAPKNIPPTWQVKRQGRKRSVVLVDVRLLYILGSVAVGGVLYAAWVNFPGSAGAGHIANPTADQLWRQQSVPPLDWNIDDVQVWASGLGLRAFAAGLQRNGVDGQLLLTLGEHEVRKDLGVSSDLQVHRIMLALEKLKTGDKLPPSASRQDALQKGLNGSLHALPKSANAPWLRNEPAVAPLRTYSLFRIWQKMSSDEPFMIFEVDQSKSWAYHIDAIREKVIAREGQAAGRSSSRKSEHKAGDSVGILLKTRNGVTIEGMRQLPTDTRNIFLMVGQELFFFPDDVIGEKLTVPLPSSQRSVQVEVLSNTPRLMLIENFLSPSECEEIKKLARDKLEPSTVLAQGDQSKGENKVKDSVRTSETAWLMNKQEPTVAKIRNRVAELVQLPMTYAEDMQVLKYGFKQHYHVHYDFFDPKMYPGDKRWASGHNRLATVFFYLTSVESGGETVFPYANTPPQDHHKIHAYGPCEDAAKTSLKVPAKQGHAIIFYHMDPGGHLDGKLDRTALHGGCDPIVGEKWAANYWIRNGPVL